MYANFARLAGRLVLLHAAPGRRLRQTHALQTLKCRNREKLVKNLFSENLVKALAMPGYGRRHQQCVGCRVQFKMLIGMRECVVRNQGCDVREFCRFCLQKFLTRRGIEEEVTNCDRSAQREPSFLHLENFPAIDFNYRSGRLSRSTGFQAQAGNGSDGRQGFAAESQCRNAKKVFGVLQF